VVIPLVVSVSVTSVKATVAIRRMGLPPFLLPPNVPNRRAGPAPLFRLRPCPRALGLLTCSYASSSWGSQAS